MVGELTDKVQSLQQPSGFDMVVLSDLRHELRDEVITELVVMFQFPERT